MEELLRAVSLVMASLFGLAAVHKFRLAFSRSAGSHPLLSSGWRRRHAGPLAALSGVIEVVVVVLLLIVPVVGALLATGLLGFYAIDLRRLPKEAGCGCFGGALDWPRGAAIKRNVAMGCTTLSMTIAWAIGEGAVSPASGDVVGISLLLAAVLAGAHVVTAVGGADTSPRAGLGRDASAE